MSFLGGISALFKKPHYPEVREFQEAAERVSDCAIQIARDIEDDAFATMVSGMSERQSRKVPQKKTASKKRANGK